MLSVERSEKFDPELITIPDRLRHMDEQRVLDMMESFTTMGQISPIQVRIVGDGEDVILVAGRHRLEAALRLTWPKITINVVEGTDDEFRLWEIAENLHRSELTVLERSEHIAEWIRLTERKVEQVAPLSEDDEKRGQLGHVSKGGRGNQSGVAAASRDIGVPRTKARRAIKIDGITPEAKQAAREAGLDKNQSALLKVAAAPAEEQVAMVETVKIRKAESAAAVEPHVDTTDIVDEFSDFVMAHIAETDIPALLRYLEKVPHDQIVAALRRLTV